MSDEPTKPPVKARTYHAAKADYEKGKGKPVLELTKCLACSDPTPHGVLAMYGSRCSRCYAAYCVANNDAGIPAGSQTAREMHGRVRGRLHLSGLPDADPGPVVETREEQQRRIDAYARNHGIRL